MTTFHDTCLPLYEQLFAPTQLYILLAITMTTFSWLLKSGTRLDWVLGWGLIVFLVYSILAHPAVAPQTLVWVHWVGMVAYAALTYHLFRRKVGEPFQAPWMPDSSD